MSHALRLTASKIRSRIEVLRKYRFLSWEPIDRFRFMRLPDARSKPDLDGDDTSWPQLEWNSYWAGAGTHFLLRSTICVSAEDGASFGLHLPLGESADGYIHPEALLYIDGRPIASTNRHSRTIRLDPEHCDGRPHRIALHGWTGLSGWGPDPADMSKIMLSTCAIVRLDDALARFITLSSAALDSSELIDENRPEKYRILNALDAAFLVLDTREPIGQGFRSSVPEALVKLEAGLAEAGAPLPVTLHAIGHAHMDIAYLWPIAEIRQKNARTYANVLRLMDAVPEFRFSHSQPQLYRYTEEDFPELFARIKDRVRDGRWEVLGGMWVEPDANIPGGEALVRQLLLGRRYFRDRFGDAESPVLWLPDTFGFPASLPQLMKLAGLTYFVTNKLGWNQYNRMPSSTTRWRGIDGSEVIAHFLTTPRVVRHLPFPTNYKSDLSAEEVFGTWTNSSTKESLWDLPICYGYGDGGGGPNEELVRKAQSYDRMPAMPRVRFSTVREFFAALEATAPSLPDWDGELYMEGHRGVLTTHGWIKRANRKAEIALHNAEAARVMAGQPGMPSELTRAWELLCLNQFHDILAGTSIGKVFDDARRDFCEIDRLVNGVTGKSLERLESRVADGSRWLIANLSPCTQTALIELDETERSAGPLKDLVTGSALATQEIETGVLVELSAMPPYSCVCVGAGETSPACQTGSFVKSAGDGHVLENELLRLEFDARGLLRRVHDKENRREVFQPGSIGNDLQVFEDRPISWDAWDIDAFFEDRGESIEGLRSIDVIESGPLRASLRIERSFRDSTIVQDVMLARGSRRVDFRTRVEWRERHALMKVAFPVDIRSQSATCEIQWGEIDRPTHRNTSWDHARFEVAAHKWVDLSEGNYGVALLNDCKYGHDVAKGTLRISLLRSPVMPDPDSDQGSHEFNYSLLPHADRSRRTVRSEAHGLNNPPVVHRVSKPVASDPPKPFVTCDSPNVIIETLKPAEDGDGFIVRLYEAERCRGSVTIGFGNEIGRAFLCDLQEKEVGEVNVTDNRIMIDLGPFEIVTLRCVPHRP